MCYIYIYISNETFERRYIYVCMVGRIWSLFNLPFEPKSYFIV